MQARDPFVAKREVGCVKLQGCSWRKAVQAAGVQMSRATVYQLRQRMPADGKDALDERRQGQIRYSRAGAYSFHRRGPPHLPVPAALGCARASMVDGGLGTFAYLQHAHRAQTHPDWRHGKRRRWLSSIASADLCKKPV